MHDETHRYCDSDSCLCGDARPRARRKADARAPGRAASDRCGTDRNDVRWQQRQSATTAGTERVLGATLGRTGRTGQFRTRLGGRRRGLRYVPRGRSGRWSTLIIVKRMLVLGMLLLPGLAHGQTCRFRHHRSRLRRDARRAPGRGRRRGDRRHPASPHPRKTNRSPGQGLPRSHRSFAPAASLCRLGAKIGVYLAARMAAARWRALSLLASRAGQKSPATASLERLYRGVRG